MRRRLFITALGVSASWPLAALAQQSAIPMIGYLSSFPAEFTQAFRLGLNDVGFVEGRDVRIEYRLADEGQSDRLPAMAAELADLHPAVIFATPTTAAIAAKTANASTPIVFAIGSDPIANGLVASLSRPGGNLTGTTFLNVELGAKRLELLRDLVPGITSIVLLVNPTSPGFALQTREMQTATTALGLQLNIVGAGSLSDLDNCFAALARQRTQALVVGPDPFFFGHSHQLVALAERHSIPTIYYGREFVAAGGLISYGSSISDSIRRAATYVGRILRGEKPADLPVQQPTQFDLTINLKTAKALGLTVPPNLLATADLVIE